jgi:DNA-binding NtrC family response regulator
MSLCANHIQESANELGKKLMQVLSSRAKREQFFSAFSHLLRYEWPDNVRELRNIVGRLAINHGIPRSTLQHRMQKLGIEAALTRPNA